MHFRYDQNLFLLCFLIFQVLVLVCYLKFSYTWIDGPRENVENLPKPVRFVQDLNKASDGKLDVEEYRTYYNADIDNEVYLKTENVEDYFMTVNNTICFKFGTDIGYMKRNMEIINENGKCECLPGYHGNDCSLPEVIWRAFIAFRRETVIHKRNAKSRRVVHMFHVTHPAQIPLTVIKINELFDTVDLFIVTETNKTEYGDSKPLHFKLKLDKGLLKDKQYKILYSPVYVGRGELGSRIKSPGEISWEKSRRIIRNLREDDLFIELDSSEIPNPKALLFFKLYDGFSLPVQFRLKWNVYGYYYQHPSKTRRVTTGSTIRMLDEVYKNNPDAIQGNRGLTIGDLNHYGGWFCDLCYDPKDILNVIQTFNEFEEILSQTSKTIDAKYVEEVIGDGLYVDGKTVLMVNHEDRDPYYAPTFVSNNFWKFDSLLINFYNKIDYN